MNKLLSSCRLIPLLFFLLPLLFVAQGAAPGFKTTLSQAGISYVKDVGMKILESKIGQLSIPDQSGEVDTPIGKIDWDLKNIQLEGVKFPQTSISLQPGTGLLLQLQQLGCSVNLAWHYRRKSFPHVSGSGTADINVNGASASISLKVVDNNQRPSLQVLSVSVNVGDLDIHVHGGASWLYQIFIKVLAGPIKKGIDNALNNALTTNINTLVNNALSTLPIRVPINSQVEIDFPLVADPIFASSYATLPQLGEFYEVNHHQECPFTPSPLPDSVTSQMAQMQLSDFVVNSALFVFFDLGKLSVTLQDKDLPSWSPIRLNTAAFKILLPNLYSMYPDLMMQIKVYAAATPQSTISSQGAQISVTGNVDAFVIAQNQTLIPVFSLNGTIVASALASLQGTNICPKINYGYGNFSVHSTEIGPFDVSLLVKLLNALFSDGFLPFINAFLQKGFPLPTVKGITFNNPQLIWNQGFVTVSTDITYNPQHLQEKPKHSLILN